MELISEWKYLVRKPKSNYQQLFVKDRWVAATHFTDRLWEKAHELHTNWPRITGYHWKPCSKRSLIVNLAPRRFKRIGSANSH